MWLPLAEGINTNNDNNIIIINNNNLTIMIIKKSNNKNNNVWVIKRYSDDSTLVLVHLWTRNK